MAQFFYQRYQNFGFHNVRLLRLQAKPEHVLATLFGEESRKEGEVIVDPAGAVGRYEVGNN